MFASVRSRIYCEALARFIGAFRGNVPWFFSIFHAVERKDKTPNLYKTLGLSESEAVEFYLAAGFLSIKPNNEGQATVHVNREVWRTFLAEFKLEVVREYEITPISRDEYQFLDTSNRNIHPSSLLHLQRNQYVTNNRPLKPSFKVSIAQRQFRSELNNIALREEDIELECLALEKDDADVTTNCVTEFDKGLPKTCIDEVTPPPLLLKLAGGKDNIDNKILCALLSDIRQMPDCSNGKIDFQFPNDSNGRIVYVPWHTSQSAFMKRAGSKNCRWVESILLSQLGGDDNDDSNNAGCCDISIMASTLFFAAQTSRFPDVKMYGLLYGK
jgi:hypothetical protein